jgi:regulatory protein YycH of two-component signal transduction system YycFG
MKIKLLLCLFVTSLVLTFLIGTGSVNVKAASDDNWFLKAKYGLFVTWAFSDPP